MGAPDEDAAYPFGEALVPSRFDRHTVVLLIRPANAPAFSEEELESLQVEHLTYLRDLQRRGLVIANGPLDRQTDARLRGITIYRAALDEALALARADPMVVAGRLAIDGAEWLTPERTARFGPG